jgi:hypothetical protein
MITVLHPSVFIESAEAKHVDTATAYLLVQTGNGFIGFASFQPTEKKVNSWVLFELEQDITSSQLEDKLSNIAAAYTWVHTNYQKVILLQYASLNVLVRSVIAVGAWSANKPCIGKGYCIAAKRCEPLHG